MKYGQYIVPLAKKCINFKVGQPSPKLLPLNLISQAASEKFNLEKYNDPLLLQYGAIPGYFEFRQSLAYFLSANYHREVNPEHLFITSGISSALSLICSLGLKRGDTICVEDPTYFLATSIFKDYGINCKPVKIEKDGLDLRELEHAFQDSNIKWLYMIPTAHNPTGRTTSEYKRKKIAELSLKYNFNIISDDVYQMLTFPHVPPINTMSGKNVISLGSFSKILAPGLRLGWIETENTELVASKLTTCGQLDSSGGMNPVISALVHVLLDNGKQQEHLNSLRQTLWKRADVMLNAIEQHLVPLGCEYERPTGGYFIFVKLPYDVPVCSNVEYLKFDNKWIRLSFSYYEPDELEEGIIRLAKHIKDYKDFPFLL